MITKTTYLSFIQCPKSFWLAKQSPSLAVPPDTTAQRRLREGQKVDQLARKWFPDGVLIPYRPQSIEMAKLTGAAIADGAETLFQTTFAVDDLLVKVDLLTKTASGWHLIEVKSTTKAKPEHVSDVAFQLFVLQQAGLAVTQASIMHLNTNCRAPNLSNLFTLSDITNEAVAALPKVEADVTVMRQLVSESVAPDVHIGRHCTRPHNCSFYAHCWQGVDGLTIYDIPRLSGKRERPLQQSNILYLSDVPSDAPLTTTQHKFVDFFVQKQVDVDIPAIQNALEMLTYPLYFFDFETIDYAIPVFDGCKPYQQVPFQYSCHILNADGTLTHREYLHTGQDDPRRPLTQALLNDMGETGSIIVYYAPFERGRLRELADVFPEYAPQLLQMVDRLWDQLDIFKKYYKDYRFNGSNSLKSVLPVVVPELNYEALDVQNGTQAQVVWEEMIGTAGETAVKAAKIKQLLAYCHLDTLAMVEIHYVLANL